MPFLDLTLPERERFLKQTTGNHIPGYTGHCPTLKFRYGKRYGADTREIIEEFRDISPVQLLKPYKDGDPELSALQETVREKGEEFDPVIYTNLPKRPFILGYTGFIPGLNFEYGIPFTNAAQKSLLKFARRLTEEERKRQRDSLNRLDKFLRVIYLTSVSVKHRTTGNDFSQYTLQDTLQFLNSTPQMCCVRSRDEVSTTLDENTRRFYEKYVSPIQPELPPIAGYTGHIPRVKGSEASLSQRYYSAAKAGLSMLREERKKKNYLNLAKEAVADAISYSHVQQR